MTSKMTITAAALFVGGVLVSQLFWPAANAAGGGTFEIVAQASTGNV